MKSIVQQKLTHGQPPAAPVPHLLMRAEAVKRHYTKKLQAVLAAYDRDIVSALSGLENHEYRRVEQEAYRWRLTRDFRPYFRPWEAK